jgi:transposase
MTIVNVGIDLAKNVFALHGVNEIGQVDLRRPSVARAKLHELVAALPPCTIGMEACSGAHHWARLFAQCGHTVKLMAPKLVTPYRMSGKRGKTDAADAAAICEAVQRPNMRFVPVKTVEQQSRLMVHRTRQGFVESRTAIINRIRGLLAEFGIVLPQKAQVVRREAARHMDGLPGFGKLVIEDLLDEIRHLDERTKAYDAHVRSMARDCTATQQLMQIIGIGEVTATAIVAMVGNAREFSSSRQFAAWLGLVPGQYSSGGKTRLGRITKAGDAYLRGLLVMGARAVLNAAGAKDDGISRWAKNIALRRGYWKAVVAVAAKNARLAWAALTKGESFTMPA